MRSRFAAAMLLLLMAGLALLPSVGAAVEAADAEETDPLVYSRVIDVPGVGEWYYYAQNDPRWAKSVYEPLHTEKIRNFGGGGCGPTSLAIALSRQLDAQDMPRILEHKSPSLDGYFYCPCSINSYHCSYRHEPIMIATPEAFQENLPLVVGSYATGNNAEKRKYRDSAYAGTNLTLLQDVAEDYGLEYVGTNKWATAYQALQEGYSVITTVGKGYFTGSSHYMVVAHADEEWIYILDPLMREEYERDTAGRLEVIEPGLVRASMTDFERLGLAGFYMIRNPEKH